MASSRCNKTQLKVVVSSLLCDFNSLVELRKNMYYELCWMYLVFYCQKGCKVVIFTARFRQLCWAYFQIRPNITLTHAIQDIFCLTFLELWYLAILFYSFCRKYLILKRYISIVLFTRENYQHCGIKVIYPHVNIRKISSHFDNKEIYPH